MPRSSSKRHAGIGASLAGSVWALRGARDQRETERNTDMKQLDDGIDGRARDACDRTH